ncbi:tRNA uridine 5-carboxymethylaminomethyl modification enzyme MnmG [Striga asiatica]|uniref:tRNA uridine 5-carboxymethylaminomethyl modification enzyme MnmG n=1 Tax=Striga asiatica TaxID=4170 RepID=A0A5A7P0C6_STRAF|nr:tRNA uridine 5-carboxymethylaminomethyl modification enzyme MnmG [Striga asiatica]
MDDSAGLRNGPAALVLELERRRLGGHRRSRKPSLAAAGAVENHRLRHLLAVVDTEVVLPEHVPHRELDDSADLRDGPAALVLELERRRLAGAGEAESLVDGEVVPPEHVPIAGASDMVTDAIDGRMSWSELLRRLGHLSDTLSARIGATVRCAGEGRGFYAAEGDGD